MNNPRYLTDQQIADLWNAHTDSETYDYAPRAIKFIATAAADKAYQEGLAEAESKVHQREIRTLLNDARLEIEYLQEKFTATGSGNAILSRLEAWLKE